MIKVMTLPQLRLTCRAESFFRDVLARSEIHSMFRQEGPDMSVGLALSVGTDHFIVRRTIPSDTPDELVGAMFAELLATLGELHLSVLGYPFEITR